MSFLLIFILVALSILSAVAVFLLLTRKWWRLKNLKVSFPDIDESFVIVLLKKTFGNAKLEKRISFWWGKTRMFAFQLARRFKESTVALKIKEKTDHLLGKSRAIPEKETSSVFLKSIAEHKKKMQEEEVEKIDKPENMPG